jgi:TetR/AcrR family transcriptional regulator, mexJK operon transcriptional repressor
MPVVATLVQTSRRTRGPSASKQRAVLAAAREVFVELGYAGASLDEVATRAGVSRQTVYTHFHDKERLFSAMVEAEVGQVDGPHHPLDAALADSDDVESDLRTYACYHLSLVMQPHLIALRRMLIGEAGRFPTLATAWYREGPERSCHTFARWFARLHERGLLVVPDPWLAAQHYNWLVLSIPLNRAMAAPLTPPPFSTDDLTRHAHEAVRIFLAAYGKPAR